MEEADERRSLIIFGRDVSMIPCFRKSFLFGFGSGFVGGLASFMFTSKPRFATHMSVATFVGSTWTYWMFCRYNWSKQEKEAAKLKLVMEQHALYGGTPKDRELDSSLTSPLVEA